MQFIVLGKITDKYAGKPIADMQDVLKGEWAASREWYKKGWLRETWLRADNIGSIGIFEVESRAKMDEIIVNYPGIKEGLVTAEIQEIVPYAGFFFDMIDK